MEFGNEMGEARSKAMGIVKRYLRAHLASPDRSEMSERMWWKAYAAAEAIAAFTGEDLDVVFSEGMEFVLKERGE